jgi:plasmid maintenance system killer protein
MDILFRRGKLRKLCNSSVEAIRWLGPDMAKRLMQRLDELHAVTTLADVRLLPQARGHELTGDRKGQLSVDLKHPYRLILEPANDPVPRKPDGGLDWTKVTAVRVLEVTDTHG